MRLTLFGMLDLDEKVKSPTGLIKKVSFHLLVVAMLLLLTDPIDPERDEHHPRIDQKRGNDDDNPRMWTENLAQLKEKKEDDLRYKHSIIGEIQYNQMRYFLFDAFFTFYIIHLAKLYSRLVNNSFCLLN